MGPQVLRHPWFLLVVILLQMTVGWQVLLSGLLPDCLNESNSARVRAAATDAISAVSYSGFAAVEVIWLLPIAVLNVECCLLEGQKTGGFFCFVVLFPWSLVLQIPARWSIVLHMPFYLHCN